MALNLWPDQGGAQSLDGSASLPRESHGRDRYFRRVESPVSAYELGIKKIFVIMTGDLLPSWKLLINSRRNLVSNRKANQNKDHLGGSKTASGLIALQPTRIEGESPITAVKPAVLALSSGASRRLSSLPAIVPDSN
jgi:hypothetical protein